MTEEWKVITCRHVPCKILIHFMGKLYIRRSLWHYIYILFKHYKILLYVWDYWCKYYFHRLEGQSTVSLYQNDRVTHFKHFTSEFNIWGQREEAIEIEWEDEGREGEMWMNNSGPVGSLCLMFGHVFRPSHALLLPFSMHVCPFKMLFQRSASAWHARLFILYYTCMHTYIYKYFWRLFILNTRSIIFKTFVLRFIPVHI